MKITQVFKKIIPIVLCVALLLTMVTAFIGCDKATDKEGGKAIIILPGLMASGLYDSATNEPVWDPFDVDLWFKDVLSSGQINFNTILPLLLHDESVQEALANITANNFEGNENSIFNKLAVNEDGTPKVESIKPADMNYDNPVRLRYGPINAYADMYNAMVERYGDEYEVSVFNYDFRMDNRIGAQKLEEFINCKGYDEVIFMPHSNGGHVLSIYLANSQENRDKTSMVLCFDSPLTGSLTAITMLENIDGTLDGILNIIPDSMSSLEDTITHAFEKQYKPLLNMYTPYQLLPIYDILKSPQYNMNLEGEGSINEKSSFIKIKEYGTDSYDDVMFDSPEALYEFYLSREWSTMSNGEIRPVMQSWLDYSNASYVKMRDGTRVHSMSLVNTQYIAGSGYATSKAVLFDEEEDGSLVYSGTETTMYGDSVVLVFGSLENAALDRIHIIENADHYDVAQSYDTFSKAMIYEIVDEYLAEIAQQE